jgi:hypothetical protein
MKTLRSLVLVTAASASLFSGCFDSTSHQSTPATAAEFDSEVARDWMDLTYQIVKSEALSPPPASRVYGYAGVAFYEAVVDGTPGKRSLGGQLNGLAALPAPAAGEHHWPTVANAASAEFLRGFFPAGQPANLAAIDALEALHADAFEAELSTSVFERSVARGYQVADAILAWAATDGYASFNNCAYVPPVGPGLWVPTPPAFAPNPLQPCWGELRTFVLIDGTECAPVGPPTFDNDPLSSFYSQALEVYVVRENLTPAQEDIARFWADGPTATGTPAGHWVAILSQVAEQQDLTLAKAAEGYAKIGVGMADAFIACWNSKYQVNLCRPVTFIRDEIDPTWTSFIGTPAFPEYTSGHSTQSGAASILLQDLLGSVPFVDDTHAGTFPARSFDSFTEAAAEAAMSRLYGGIHFRAACEHGVEQGHCIAQTLLDTLEFDD